MAGWLSVLLTVMAMWWLSTAASGGACRGRYPGMAGGAAGSGMIAVGQ